MQILRSLLNSGVFMVLLVVAVSIYLAYSEQIQSSLEDLELASSNVLSRASTESVTTVVAAEPAVVAAEPAVVAAEPAVVAAEPAVVAAEPAVVAAEPAVVAAEPVRSEVAPMPAMPEMASMPAMPEMAPMPAMPEMAPMPAMPEMAPMPAMPEMAPMPAMPEMAPMPAMPKMASMPAMPEMAPMPAMPKMASMPAMPEIPMSPMVQPSIIGEDSVLEAARAAFQAGNLDQAETMYRTILSKSDNPDAYGELGNIFFFRQQYNAANDAYLKAAEGLIAQNRLLQAQYVIGMLMNSQPEYAQKAMKAFNDKLQSNR